MGDCSADKSLLEHGQNKQKPCIVIMAIPTYGHTLPMLKICSYLVKEGYEVVFIGGSEHEKQILRAGAEFVVHPPWMTAEFKEARDRIDDSMERGLFEIKQVYIGSIPQRYQVMKKTLEQIRRLQANRQVVVVHECLSALATIPFHYGAPLPKGYQRFPKVINIPIYPLFISSIDTALFGSGDPPVSQTNLILKWMGRLRNWFIMFIVQRHKMVRSMIDCVNETLALTGARPIDGWLPDVLTTDADTTLMVCSPSMEYPRRHLSPKIHFIGCLPNNSQTTSFRPTTELPEWWSIIKDNAALLADTKKKKLVMVTQGTLAVDYEDVVIPTIYALADRTDVLVVAILGIRGAQLPTKVTLPEHVFIADYLPYELLLALADVAVLNGGYGGWTQAVMYGVPSVIVGATEEKKETVMRGQWSGTSVGMKKKRVTAEEMRQALEEVLGDAKYKKRNMELKAENESLDALGQVDSWIQHLSR